MAKIKYIFLCPNDGKVRQKDVSFICNRCGSEKTKKVGNMYLCPECLEPNAPLECRLCGSQRVKMRKLKQKK